MVTNLLYVLCDSDSKQVRKGLALGSKAGEVTHQDQERESTQMRRSGIEYLIQPPYLGENGF